LETFKKILALIINFDFINQNIESFKLDTISNSKNLKIIENLIINKENLNVQSNTNFNSKFNLSKETIDIITQNKIYEMEINFPSIEMKIQEENNIMSNITFLKTADKEFMINLIKNEFDNWEENIIYYLSEIRIYRTSITSFINQISFSNYNYLKNQNKIIQIDSECKHRKSNIKILDEFNFKSQENKLKRNFYDAILCFDYKGENFIKYFKILSYCVDVNVKFTKKETKNFKLDFSLKYMKKLNSVSEFWNLEEIVKRCIAVDITKRDVFLDYSILDQLDEDYIDRLKKVKDHYKFDRILDVKKDVPIEFKFR